MRHAADLIEHNACSCIHYTLWCLIQRNQEFFIVLAHYESAHCSRQRLPSEFLNWWNFNPKSFRYMAKWKWFTNGASLVNHFALLAVSSSTWLFALCQPQKHFYRPVISESCCKLKRFSIAKYNFNAKRKLKRISRKCASTSPTSQRVASIWERKQRKGLNEKTQRALRFLLALIYLCEFNWHSIKVGRLLAPSGSASIISECIFGGFNLVVWISITCSLMELWNQS